MRDERLVADLWRRQSVWSQAADRLKRSIGRARTAALALTIAGAVLGALAGALAGPLPMVSRVLAVAAMVAVGLLPVLRPGWSGKALRDWTRARSVSEALKSEVYLWLARVGNYRGDDRDDRLRERTDALLRSAADLLRHTADLRPRGRDLPAIDGPGSYFEQRTRPQAEGYYRDKAADLRRRLRVLRVGEIALAAVGVLLAAMAAAFPGAGVGPWVAVVTTVSAAVVAHVAAARYEYQLVEYLRTADELDRLLRDASSPALSPREREELVERSERVISIQNEGWMAKLSADPEQPART